MAGTLNVSNIICKATQRTQLVTLLIFLLVNADLGFSGVRKKTFKPEAQMGCDWPTSVVCLRFYVIGSTFYIVAGSMPALDAEVALAAVEGALFPGRGPHMRANTPPSSCSPGTRLEQELL